MHILVLPSWFEDVRNPTSGSFFKDQARALKNLDHQVGIIHPTVISLKTPQYFRLKKHKLDEETGLPIISLCYFSLPKCRSLNIRRRIYQYEKLFLLYTAQYGKPEILHAHSCALGPFGSAGLAARHISKKYNIPYVITEHGSAFHTDYYQPADIPFIQTAFADATSIIAVSDSLVSDLKEFGVKKPIHVIGNIVDTKAFQTASQVYPPVPRQYTFITIAYLRAIKQIDILIKAFAHAFTQNSNLRLIILGDGEQRPQLEDLVDSFQLSEHVRFTGELPRDLVAKHLANSDCYVLTSTYETFAVAAHEALAAGKAVIATPCGGPETTLRQLSEVVLLDSSIEALSAAMLQQSHIEDNDERRVTRHHYIDTNFNSNAIGKKIEKVLLKALAK